MVRVAYLAAAVSAAVLYPLSAHALEAPTERVVLTVTGVIDEMNAAGSAEFDMPMLEALAGRTAEMETPWTEGTTGFEGPLLRSVLEAVGAHGATLRITALNDYSAEVPASDATDFATILAVTMNGKPMSVRDKGPLFLIYPFDERPDLYNEKYFSRSVWQIKAIEVIE
jgi:hypothetical protein